MMAQQSTTIPDRITAHTAPAHPDARILIVDDESANVKVMTRLLEAHGYRHVSALLDPRQLLLSFLELKPDVVLLDLHMPHLDGFAVLQLLRDWLPPDDYFPVIVLTADVTTDARRRALAAGATDFLTKPINAFEVLIRVEHQLRTRFLHLALQERSDVLAGRLSAVLEALDQIVWTAAPDGRLTYVSEAAEAVVGWPVLGDDQRALWPAYAHAEDASLAAGWLTRLRVQDRLDVEHRIVRPDGSVRWLESRCRLIRDDLGKPTRIDGVSVDVTERRRLADEVARLAAQRERDRLAANLIATVSHEIRSPLTSLVGFASLLQETSASAEERASWTSLLLSEAERLNELVNDILDASALDAGRVELHVSRFDMCHLADTVLAPFAAGEDGQRLVRAYPQRPVHISADRIRIHRVLTNLVSNALKYSPDGGPVELAIRSEDDRITLSVTDHGLGLNEDDLARLFQRFQRVGGVARQDIPGSGLGLSICRQLVELHGGRIWAASAGRGAGSTFTVELPTTPTVPAAEESAGSGGA